MAITTVLTACVIRLRCCTISLAKGGKNASSFTQFHKKKSHGVDPRKCDGHGRRVTSILKTHSLQKSRNRPLSYS